jgi:hypothetical protein
VTSGNSSVGKVKRSSLLLRSVLTGLRVISRCLVLWQKERNLLRESAREFFKVLQKPDIRGISGDIKAGQRQNCGYPYQSRLS